MLRVPTIRLNRAEGRALARLPKKARVTRPGRAGQPVHVRPLPQGAGPGPRRPVVRGPHPGPGRPGPRGARPADARLDVHRGRRTRSSRATRCRTRGSSRSAATRARGWSTGFPTPTPAGATSVVTPESRRERDVPAAGRAADEPARRRVPRVRRPGAEHAPGRRPRRSSPARTRRSPSSARATGMQLERSRPFVDQDGNHGAGLTPGRLRHATWRSWRTASLIGETDNVLVRDRRAAGRPVDGRRCSFTTDNPQSWAELSTHTDTTWTFPSATAPDDQVVVEPLLLPGLRRRCRPAQPACQPDPGEPVSFDLSARPPRGRAPGAGADRAGRRVVRRRRHLAEGDGRQGRGSGWRVTLPPGTGYVSLRLRADDTAGSAVDQTVIRAFDVTR